MLTTVETYEEGTGKIIETHQVEIPDVLPPKLEQLIKILVKKGVLTNLDCKELT